MGIGSPFLPGFQSLSLGLLQFCGLRQTEEGIMSAHRSTLTLPPLTSGHKGGGGPKKGGTQNPEPSV